MLNFRPKPVSFEVKHTLSVLRLTPVRLTNNIKLVKPCKQNSSIAFSTLNISQHCSKHCSELFFFDFEFLKIDALKPV